MLQNLQNLPNFKSNQRDNLADFEKCCKTRILAKNGADTAENEQHFAEVLPKIGKNYTLLRWVFREGFDPDFGGSVQRLSGSGSPVRRPL